MQSQGARTWVFRSATPMARFVKRACTGKSGEIRVGGFIGWHVMGDDRERCLAHPLWSGMIRMRHVSIRAFFLSLLTPCTNAGDGAAACPLARQDAVLLRPYEPAGLHR